jgi:hypothetical protein
MAVSSYLTSPCPGVVCVQSLTDIREAEYAKAQLPSSRRVSFREDSRGT